MKNFHFDGPTWAFLTPEQMYDEEGKLRRAHKHYQNADIYFLSIMNKCLFEPSKTKVLLDGRIKCQIRVGDPLKKKFNHVIKNFPLYKILHAAPGIKNQFKNEKEFLSFILFERYRPKGYFKKIIYEYSLKLLKAGFISQKLCLKILTAIYSSEIKVYHETRFEINIFDPLVQFTTNNKKAEQVQKDNPRLSALNEADWDTSKTKDIDYSKLPGAKNSEYFRLTIDQVINYFNIEVGNQKIAYIGKTKQMPFDRLFPHEKLNELDAKLLRNEYETLIIHLFKFANWDEPISSNRPTTFISKADAITITEAELINYFKPTENTTFVKNDGKANWKHIKLLKRNKYRKIRGLLDVDGQYAKFHTLHVGDKKLNKHEINIDLAA